MLGRCVSLLQQDGFSWCFMTAVGVCSSFHRCVLQGCVLLRSCSVALLSRILSCSLRFARDGSDFVLSLSLSLFLVRCLGVFMGYPKLSNERAQNSLHRSEQLLNISLPHSFGFACWISVALQKEKGGVMQIVPARGLYKLFCIPIPPLPIVPSLTCSVTSLRRSPGH